MQEVCGYKTKDGRFFDNEKAAKKADLDYEIKDVKKSLQNFWRIVDEYLWETRNRIHSPSNYSERLAQEVVSKMVLKYSDEFIALINQKKKLEKTLDTLREELSDLNRPWWLKIIWWK